jgi:hypothetical protein
VLTCLFWNFRCSLPDSERIAARLALLHRVDILVLAEAMHDPLTLLAELKRSDPEFDLPTNQHERFQVYTRFPGRCLRAARHADRVSVRRLSLPPFPEILFAFLHLVDRRNYEPGEQSTLSLKSYQVIYNAEKDAGHSRTVAFGDFNMNPFDQGMVNSEGFGAVMTRSLAVRLSGGRLDESRKFYNPMWSRLGRELPEPPGTYYYDARKPFNVFWHSLDQVLIRPALFDAFRDEDFQILTTTPDSEGSPIDLVRQNPIHCNLNFSDHLPILFRLDLRKET